MKDKILLLTALCAIVAPVCRAADSPWSGTWKLNEAKSQRTGDVDTLTQAADGKYTVATSGLSFSFGCDGADYPIPGGHVISCSKVGANAFHIVSKMNGDELGQTDRTLSDNGNTMTVVTSGKAPDGTAFHDTQIYKKIARGTGDAWTGSWQSTQVQQTGYGLAVVEATADGITFTYPMQKARLNAKLDGTPAAEEGPHAEQGLSISLTAAGPRTIHEVDTLNGTVIEHDTMSVSPDGKTMTVEAQRTGNKVKQVYVYDKQ